MKLQEFIDILSGLRCSWEIGDPAGSDGRLAFLRTHISPGDATDSVCMCPITAVAYYKLGVVYQVCEANQAGNAIGLSTDLRALIVDAADVRLSELERGERYASIALRKRLFKVTRLEAVE